MITPIDQQATQVPKQLTPFTPATRPSGEGDAGAILRSTTGYEAGAIFGYSYVYGGTAISIRDLRDDLTWAAAVLESPSATAVAASGMHVDQLSRLEDAFGA